MHLRQVVMSCVQHKRRAAARERRARRARRATSGPDDAPDAPPVKRGRPTKDNSLVKRLAKKAGVCPEIILLTDRVEYVDDDDEEEDAEEDVEEEEQDEDN